MPLSKILIIGDKLRVMHGYGIDIPDSGEPGLAAASGKLESRPSKDPYGLLSSSFHIFANDFEYRALALLVGAIRSLLYAKNSDEFDRPEQQYSYHVGCCNDVVRSRSEYKSTEICLILRSLSFIHYSRTCRRAV